LDENQLQKLFTQKDDREAFFELNRRYKSGVMAKWQKSHFLLYHRNIVEFENFFDDLLEEAILKWDPSKANFRTFFVFQVCRLRVIDFTRGLWKRHYAEARPESELRSGGQVLQDDEDIISLIEAGSKPWGGQSWYSEEDLELFRKALAREKEDCQQLLRLMLYKGPKKFEEKSQILAIMGYKKKPTGWRDTWKRNRERIVTFIQKNRKF
jgi:hypothetical protein